MTVSTDWQKGIPFSPNHSEGNQRQQHDVYPRHSLQINPLVNYFLSSVIIAALSTERASKLSVKRNLFDTF